MFKQLPLNLSPNIKSTYDSYYTSDVNRFAVESLKHFLQQSEELQFYLWGPVSVGVTHLLEASQNFLQSSSVQYLPLKSLVDYSPSVIIEGMEYREIVFIDDIESIAGLSEWEVGLFHLFNRLRDAGKRIIVGSHFSPRQLPIRLADLKSRLQWGVVFHLEALSDDEKTEAMIFVSKQLGMELSEELAQYLLHRTHRSTVELFNMVDRLDEASLAEQRKLTIPFVKKVLGF